MARIAIRAVVNVVADALVLVVHVRLVVLVACQAREHLEVRRIRMAVCAGIPFSRVLAGIDGKLRVVKNGAEPRRRSVTRAARGREICGCVVRAGRILKIQFVARIASRRSAHVLPTDVATGARSRGVLSGEREGREVVIERRGDPRWRGVTDGTGCREARRFVVRSGRAVVAGQVA